MEKKFDQILKDWKSRKFDNVYFLYGEEEYFIDELVKYAEKQILNESEQAFNQIVLYGKEINYQHVLDNSYQFPMMAEYRLVIVKEAQAMRDLDKIEVYLDQPSEQTILVLAHKHKKLDKRKKIWKKISGSAVTFESKKLYENKMGAFINNLLKDKKLSISPLGIQTLVAYLGTDLSKVSNEINKLAINLGEGATITEKEIQSQIGISKDFNVFELINALAHKDAFKAFQIAKYFGENPKSNPMPLVVSNLLSFFRKVSIAQENAGMDKRSLAQKIGVNPFFMDQYMAATRNFSKDELRRSFQVLRDIDLKSKGMGAMNLAQHSLMKEMVNGFLHA